MGDYDPGEKKPHAPNNEREMDAFWDFVLAVVVLAGLWGVVTTGIGAILWSVFPMTWWGAVAAGMTPAFIVLWIIMDQNK